MAAHTLFPQWVLCRWQQHVLPQTKVQGVVGSRRRKSLYMIITIFFFFLCFDQLEIEGVGKKENMLDIFTTPYLRNRTLIMGFIW